MLTIPQFLDFPSDGQARELCDFFLKMLEQKNTALYLHSQQVANYAVSIAAKMGLPFDEVACIRTAALLHDIGHLAVPNTILAKFPYLSTRELSTYKNHCLSGASMLENIPEFSHIIKIIFAHHENWDGTGYPKRLKGVNIPLGARIIAVANHYDRIINPCTQHWQKTHTLATRELRDLSGVLFDPEVVQAFLYSVVPTKKH
ncbi:MAG: HD domain-containing phosphohydrolase [Acidaminococcaceae bacterium]